MQTVPPSRSTTHIKIADEAVNRVPSNGGAGAYGQQQRLEKQESRRFSTHGKEDVEEDDERDVRKKQVRKQCCASNNRH